MNSRQYEELCRYFIAEKLALPIEQIRSPRIPNPRRPGLRAYSHQIDLYWETGNELTSHINIANAKWRATRRVNQSDMELLDKVRQEISAHKAVMITNVGFTKGAEAVAEHNEMGLWLVQSDIDMASLPEQNRIAIQAALEATATQRGGKLFTDQNYKVVRRGLDFIDHHAEAYPIPRPSSASRPVPHETRVITQPSRATSLPAANRSHGGATTRRGPGFSRGITRGGGFIKK